MSMTNDGGMYMPVGPLNSYGGAGSFGDGSFWIIVLFLFALMGNGWGGAWGGNAGTNAVNADLQRGFDQQAMMGGIGALQAGQNSIAQSLCAGFSNAENAAGARAMANLQQQFAMQTAIDGRLDAIAMTQQNCCCENRQAIADVKYTIAQESAATRLNTDGKVQLVLDKLCQLEMDTIRQNYENRIANLQTQLDALRDMNANARFDASQIAQTANIVNALKTTTTSAAG